MLYKHKKQENQEDISPTTDLTEKAAIIEVHTLSCVFITKPSSTLELQFAHFFRMTSILSHKEEKTCEGSRSRMVKNSFCRETQQEKKQQKNKTTLAAKCVKLFASVGFRSLWFFVFITNLSVQFTFPLEGWTDEHQRGVDLRFRGASVAASLRHAVVSAQHQQVGQRSVRLLRAANAKVNGLGFPRGQRTKLRSV